MLKGLYTLIKRRSLSDWIKTQNLTYNTYKKQHTFKAKQWKKWRHVTDHREYQQLQEEGQDGPAGRHSQNSWLSLFGPFFCLFILAICLRQWESNRVPVHWFTPQMPFTAWLDQAEPRSQNLHPSLPHRQTARTQLLKPPPAACQVPGWQEGAVKSRPED